MRPVDALALLGGYASRDELIRLRCPADWIDLGVRYGRILSVRRGCYAVVDTPRIVLRALRVGGRLACVSAVAFHSDTVPADESLHVVVRANASRLTLPRGERVVVHWTRRELPGSRTVVAEHIARAQAATCRGGGGGGDVEGVSKPHRPGVPHFVFPGRSGGEESAHLPNLTKCT